MNGNKKGAEQFLAPALFVNLEVFINYRIVRDFLLEQIASTCCLMNLFHQVIQKPA